MTVIPKVILKENKKNYRGGTMVNPGKLPFFHQSLQQLIITEGHECPGRIEMFCSTQTVFCIANACLEPESLRLLHSYLTK